MFFYSYKNLFAGRIWTVTGQLESVGSLSFVQINYFNNLIIKSDRYI